MRLAVIALGGVAALSGASPASAATIVIYADPMTLERRTVVVDPTGPDRAFLCVLPPSIAGCQPVAIKRSAR